MQSAEIENKGSVLKYITQSEFDTQRSRLRIMKQRLFLFTMLLIFWGKTISIIVATMFNIVGTILSIVFSKIGIVYTEVLKLPFFRTSTTTISPSEHTFRTTYLRLKQRNILLLHLLL